MFRPTVMAVVFISLAFQTWPTPIGLGHNNFLHADEPKRGYPAQIHVISHKRLDDGRLLVRLRLLIDDHVAIYANPVRAPGMDHASARISVFGEDKQSLSAKVTYPKGDRHATEFIGEWYLYRRSADIAVALPGDPPFPLIFRAKIAGYNERNSYCLGFGSVEATLTANDFAANR